MSQSLPDEGVRSAWTLLALVHAALAVVMIVISIVWYATLAPRGVSTGQAVLLAVWLGVGVAQLKTRVVWYCVLGLLVYAIGENALKNGLVILLGSSVALGFLALAVTFPLYVAWRKGWCLTSAPAIPLDDKPWLISISAILIFTLVVAVLLVLRKFVASLGEAHPDGNIGFPNTTAMIAAPIIYGVTLLGLGVSVYSSVWSSLSTSGSYSHLFATFLMMILVIACPMHVVFGSPAYIEWAVMSGSAMLTLLLSILFLRFRGVRYVLQPYSEN